MKTRELENFGTLAIVTERKKGDGVCGGREGADQIHEDCHEVKLPYEPIC